MIKGLIDIFNFNCTIDGLVLIFGGLFFSFVGLFLIKYIDIFSRIFYGNEDELRKFIELNNLGEFWVSHKTKKEGRTCIDLYTLDYKQYLKGGKKSFKDKDKKMLTAYSISKEGFRSIYLPNVNWFKLKDRKYLYIPKV